MLQLKKKINTDTAAILNLLDLKSIMVCPRGTRYNTTQDYFPKTINIVK